MKRLTFFVCFILLLLIPVGVSALTVTGVLPSTGSNTGDISNVQITGTGFISGAGVFLLKGADPQIAGSCTVLDSATINCNFPISGKTLGSYSVFVRNSASDINSLSNGFTITGTSTTTTTTATTTTGTTTTTTTASSGPSITGVSPNSGYNTSTISNVVISGSGFSTTSGSVFLTRTGESSIGGTINSWGANFINCNFPLTGKPAGVWNVLVITGESTPQSTTYTNGFTINSASSSPTLSSITPASGDVNTTVSITSLTGTNFASGVSMRLQRSNYNPIVGSVSSVNSAGTIIVGTFNLNNEVPGTYKVCVYNDANNYNCDLTFTILSPGETTATNSSIYFQSNPSGATIWLNRTKVGTSTFTYYNATPGTHLVLVQKAGYKDYTGYVTVLEGKRVTFYAALTPIGEDTTTETTTAYKTPTKTVTTIKKSTLKVPTTWPSATPTEAPVDPALALGAAVVGAGIIVMRRQ